MVRYIKDGAYTIVVEDVGGEGNKEEEDEGEENVIIGEDGTRRPIESRQKIRTKRQIEEDLEKIDLTSPEFILQNLKLAQPKYEDDDTCTLLARKEIAIIISQQILFYVYCLLQAHVHSQNPPTILFFGDGYIGCKVIELLTEYDCGPLLRIYSRGEYSTNEWRSKGYAADSNLPALMGTSKADIVIICSEYSSFQLIYHMLRDFHLIGDTTGIITSTLGFQRKRLYYNFGVPTIFRTYVEPQKLVRNLKLKQTDLQQKKAAESDEGGKENNNAGNTPSEEKRSGSQSPTKSGSHDGTVASSSHRSTASLPTGEKEKSQDLSQKQSDSKHGSSQVSLQSHQIKEEENEDTDASDTEAEDTGDNSSVASSQSLGNMSISKLNEDQLNYAEKAAFLIFQRTLDMKNILYILENYYAINELSHIDARYLSLRAIFGYIDPKRRDIPKRMNQQQQLTKPTPRKARILTSINYVEKIILTMFSSDIKYFHRFFSRLLTMNDLFRLTDINNLGILSANGGITSLPSGRAGSPEAYEQIFKKEPRVHDTYIDEKGRRHLLEHEEINKLKMLRMHNYNSINQLFEVDEDYSRRSGPGFEFMRALDGREKKKISLNSMIQKPGLNYLFNAIDQKGVPNNGFDVSEQLLAESDEPSTMPDLDDDLKSFPLPMEPTLADFSASMESGKGGFEPNIHLKMFSGEMLDNIISPLQSHSIGSASIDHDQPIAMNISQTAESPTFKDSEILPVESSEEIAKRRKERYREKLKSRAASTSAPLNVPLGLPSPMATAPTPSTDVNPTANK
eukprot:gene8896-9633_t